MNELAAIIVAAGKSQRMGGVDKQMRTVAGVPVLARTVGAFEACADVGAIVLVLNPDNMSAVSAIPASETVKVVDANGTITATPERSNLWIAQTPQIFRTSLLVAAYESLKERGANAEATDDARLVEMMGRPVKVYKGERTNIKIT